MKSRLFAMGRISGDNKLQFYCIFDLLLLLMIDMCNVIGQMSSFSLSFKALEDDETQL